MQLNYAGSTLLFPCSWNHPPHLPLVGNEQACPWEGVTSLSKKWRLKETPNLVPVGKRLCGSGWKPNGHSSRERKATRLCSETGRNLAAVIHSPALWCDYISQVSAYLWPQILRMLTVACSFSNTPVFLFQANISDTTPYENWIILYYRSASGAFFFKLGSNGYIWVQ